MKSSPKYPLLRVGVTGGIGSGKSTVCKAFSDLGRSVIIADDVARRVADEDASAKAAIRKEFGVDAYLPDGLLDRKKMASIIFGDESKREKLDRIIHPRVFSAIDTQLSSLAHNQSHRYVLIEAALIFETGMNESLDYVIVVAADEASCVQRVAARDNTSRDEVLRRMAAQMPMTKKVKQADFVIQNNGTQSELRSTVLFLDHLLSKIITARES